MTTSTTAVRTIDGTEVPPPGTYSIDPAHSYVGFSVRHLAVSKVRGRFTGFEGRIELAEDPLASTVDVEIDPSTIDTRDEQRDGHLRSSDFFEVENHPSITYRADSARPDGRGGFELDGELTVRDVTRPVPLQLTYEGSVVDPWDNVRFGFAARTELDRDEFGITWNQPLEAGGVLVGKKVTIEIEGEAVRQS